MLSLKAGRRDGLDDNAATRRREAKHKRHRESVLREALSNQLHPRLENSRCLATAPSIKARATRIRR